MRQLLLVIFSVGNLVGTGAKYEPNWESLDSRPLPEWYDEAKIGVFIHWGVFSVPSYGSEWFWQNWRGEHNPLLEEFMHLNYRPGFTYQDFGPQLTAEFFQPERWAEILNASGARYLVFTTKHHEGFTNWPSKVSWNWNSVDVGPKRDLVGELSAAIRSKQPHIHLGLYHSLFEWFNPLFLADKENNFQTNDFVAKKTMPELLELVNTYQPELLWSDGDWMADDTYWNATSFLAWLFNDSPVKDTVVVNDGWGIGIPCKHGSFYTCGDTYNPGVLQPHKWEGKISLDKASWGYRRNAPSTAYRTTHDVLTRLAETISCGGNLLVNVGASRDGMIPPLQEERLRQLGDWLTLNGEAVYASMPWGVQNDTLTPGVWFTSHGSTVYAIVLSWPEGGLLSLGAVRSTPSTVLLLLGDTRGTPLQFKEASGALQVVFPPLSEVSGQWAWVIKMEQVLPAMLETNHIYT